MRFTAIAQDLRARLEANADLATPQCLAPQSQILELADFARAACTSAPEIAHGRFSASLSPLDYGSAFLDLAPFSPRQRLYLSMTAAPSSIF